MDYKGKRSEAKAFFREQTSKAKPQLENRVRRDAIEVVAYEETCTSPRGVRRIQHRTDVHGSVTEAQARSNAFRDKYTKQGWSVTVRAVMG